MADYIVRFTGQDNLTSTIKNIKNELNQTGQTASKLDQIRDKFNRISNSSAPLKKQLRDIQALMAQMNLSGLSGSEEFAIAAQRAGQLKDAITDASKATRLLSSDTAGLDAGIQALQGFAGAAGVATGVMGLLGVENEKTQQAILKVQSVLSIMNGVQQVANVLNKDSILMLKLKQIWQKANAASTTASTTATSANTVATVANTTATSASTIAKKAWNVATAIGKALLGDFSGLILVGAGALLAYSLATSDSTDEIKEQNQALDEAKKRQQDYTENVSSNAGQLVGKYKLLQNEWNNLKTTGEKVEWIKENANQFQNLGLKVYDLKSAEDVFVNNTNNVVAALQARARAMAAQEMLVDAYKGYYKKVNQADNSVAGGGYYKVAKVGDLVVGSEAKKAGLTNKNYDRYSIRNQEQADKINNQRSKEAIKHNKEVKKEYQDQLNDETAFYINEINNGQKQAKALGLNISGGGKTVASSGSGRTTRRTTNTNKGTPPAPDNSLKWYEDKISEIDAKIKLQPDPDTAKTLLEQKKQLNKDKEALEVQIGLKEAPVDSNSLSGINKQIDQLQKELQLMPDINTDLARQKVDKLAGLINKRNDIQLQITPKLYGNKSIKAIEEQIKKIEERLANDNLNLPTRINLIETKAQLQAKIDSLTNGEVTIKANIEPQFIQKGSEYDKLLSSQNAQSNAEQIKAMYDKGIISKEEAKSRVKAINEELAKLGIKPVEIEFTTDFEDKIATPFRQFSDKASTIIGALNGIKGVTDSVQNLTNDLEEGANAWTIFTDAVAVVQSALEGINSIITATNTVMQLLGATTAATAATDTAATQQQVANSMTKVAADEAEAIAGATKSGAVLPFPMNLVAIAAGIAAVMAAIAMIGSFADGGIISGSSYHGDKLLARVNAGEMILNQRQQANLFSMLNSGASTGSGQVEFKISGSTLKGVLKNYDNKMSKVR